MAAQHQKRVVQVEETGQVVDIYKWICIYPAHIDITKKATKVRKVNKTLAISKPNVIEMADSCKHLKLEALIEDKKHPRDFFRRGRVRVKLRNEDGTFANPEITSRKKLLQEVCKLVPHHVLRTKEAQEQMQQKLQAQQTQKAASGSKSKSQSKKGKKKK